MIQAEISIYPMATKTTSVSFYIAKAIESIKNIDNLTFEINSMGTILESDDIDVINKASKNMIEIIHHLGINRVEVILKIDSRIDKQITMKEKLEKIIKYRLSYSGMKETDILYKKLILDKLQYLNENELKLLSNLFTEVSDVRIFNMLTSKEALIEKYENLIKKILNG